MTKKNKIEFKSGDRLFVYDFNKLNVEQIEFARIIGEFKAHQETQKADNYRSIIKSGGANWLNDFIAVLVIEMKDGIPITKNMDIALSETNKVIATLPASEYPKFYEVITDFFSGIKKPQIASILQQGDTKVNAKEMLLTAMGSLMQKQLSEKIG